MWSMMRVFIDGLARFAWLAALPLAACVTTTPTTNLHQPMTARPIPADVRGPANGSIYQAHSARPLFEDRRARLVGDTLTIQIVEKVAAGKKSSTDAERKASVNAGIPSIVGLPGKGLMGLSLQASNETKFEGKGDSAANYDFNGTIAVTVIEVLANGNLLVAGEKQVSINQGDEVVRFSGVVNPNNITTNTVLSSQVADARMEYKGNGAIDSVQTVGWLSRFFLNVLPF
jgi:flagellar L-ring protein FlgH